ncbi:MAG: RES family NAD+ phosphorylase [Opitutaceae bacterium]|nr:RES family NAD+ phosphorylase [Opitutaceae bacterium]
MPLNVSTRRLRAPWWNLRWVARLPRRYLFHASLSGRLTPASGKVPCLYLARNRETSFYELYGDVLDAASKLKLFAKVSRPELAHRVYIKTPVDMTVRLYDLTKEKSGRSIGMDLATLYTADVDHPREFAQRIHDHPRKFDGILYESRHTKTVCVVLWATHSPELHSMLFERGPTLDDLTSFDRRLPAGCLRLFDAVLEVSSPPVAGAD